MAVSACGEPYKAPPKRSSLATSAEDVGGMQSLVSAAKKEGTLNTIALPRDWANYGALIDGFERKYGIRVRVENPGGSSQDEINTVQARKGQANAPDVLDVGDSFAHAGVQQGLLAPYHVAAYDSIPENQKDPLARWYNNYGGYVSIGCAAELVETCPKTFADLKKPQYKDKVTLDGDPTRSGSAFAGVYAAALANHGSFDDIQPGIDFFAELKKAGNYSSVRTTVPPVDKGGSPIIISWDFLNLSRTEPLRRKGVDWRVSIPFDGSFAEYYAMAINKYAPHPAAARLWQEYLFSTEGQNLRLYGYARPVLMAAMAEDGTLDKAAAAKLPTVEGTPVFPTETQIQKAREAIARGWADAVSG
ncbi:extracellular solute-binding protein [Streptomyces sp. DSM 41528]|uniref:Extracellular solute-binding protein n=1 Tax=Streptomyces bugieae TaxID=3098223 RepID=A0ABU7NHE3_9ACTN|nr:extracellular solute-binding protein [Streptomyces nigrescens]MEE4418261.1 extracellular solute-binding protein [Streptomyces sp. DSM 41528]